MCKTLLRNLRTAIHFNDIKQVKRLLKSSAQKPLSKNPFIFGGYSLLKLAIGLRRREIAKLLINKGVRMDKKMKDKADSAIDLAIRQLYPDIIDLIISKNSSELMLMFYSYKVRYLPQISKILKRHIYNRANNSTELTAQEEELELEVACHYRQHELVKLLLKRNATIDSTILLNQDIISTAVMYKTFEVTELLLQYGAPATLRITDEYLDDTSSGVRHYEPLANQIKSLGSPTLLHVAIMNEDIETVELLINYGADVNSRTKILQRTPLLLAIEGYLQEEVELLLKNGARVDIFDENGMSPLHYIIRNPSNINIPFTIDDEVRELEKCLILNSLVEAGANVNEALEPLGNKLTFLTTAASYGQRGIVQYLTEENCSFDISLVDYNILKSTKFNINLLPEDQRNNIQLVEEIRETFIEIELLLVKAILRAYYEKVPIDETLLAIIRSKSVNDNDVDRYVGRVKKFELELSQLFLSIRERKIGDSNITVWKLLTSPLNLMVKYVRNKSVQDMCINEYLAEYNYLYDDLKSRMDVAVKRMELLTKATEIAFILLQSLPYMFCEQVCDYFDNVELELFNNQFCKILDDNSDNVN